MSDKTDMVRTSTLLRNLFKTSSIKEFMEKNTDEMRLQSFSEYITELRDKKDEVSERIIKH